MNYEESVAYLIGLGHETLAVKLGLDRVRILFAKLGDPQTKFRKLQIAGTNGKGSTASMLDAICAAAGIRTALFTSPHLIEPTERIRLNGQEIGRDDFARFASQVRTASNELVAGKELPALPSYFEQITAIFLLAAAEGPVELAILETGLGGRLDATTATEADVVGITPIDLDHQEYLGNTLTEIAAEKAAIIRPGVSTVVGPQAPEAEDVIVRRAEECGVDVRWAAGSAEERGITPDGRLRLKLLPPGETNSVATLGLRGRHQFSNASTAICLAQTLKSRGWPIDREAIVTGLETAHHPGRLELWEGPPAILFDGAHNAAGARSLADYLREFVASSITLVFGAMRDKDLVDLMRPLFPLAQTIVLTEPESPRAASVATLRDIASTVFDPERLILAWDVPVALHIALDHTSGDGLVCITGSLYLVGEAQSYLTGRDGSAPWKRKSHFGSSTGEPDV